MKNPVERDGLGYRWDIPKDGITLRADRLHESGEVLTAEVVIERAPEGRLVRTRINLLAAQTVASLGKQLGSQDRGRAVEWNTILGRFIDGVLALEREGAPFETIGRRPLRPQPPYLLRPMLYAGKPTILFGEGGVGKSSAIAAAVAVSVQTGVAVLDAWQVITPGEVLVLDWEGDGDDWNDAVARLAAGLRIEAPALHYRRMKGALDGQVHEIATYCDQHDIRLLIVDSVTWATRNSGDRGSVDEPVKRLFDALRAIGRASLLIDHKSKAAIADDQSTGASPIGSIVKVNAARATFELRKADEKDPDGTRHLALINRKVNPADEQGPLGIAVRYAGGETLMWTEPVRLADQTVARQVDAAGSLWQRIEDVLRVRGPMTGPTICGHLGIEGKDPLRTVEIAMGRKPRVFGVAGELRNTRKWFLLAEHNKQADEPTPPEPPRPEASSVSSRMAAIFSEGDWLEEVPNA